jgi:hypothetical protein
MPETLLYEDADRRLLVWGADLPDDVPVVLRSVCAHCGHEIHRRVIAMTEEMAMEAGHLAGFDAAQALAHRAVCPGVVTG